jgi:hypothetical protein
MRRSKEAFIKVYGTRKMAHDVIMHIGLYVKDHEVFIPDVIIQPISGNPLHRALPSRIRICLHNSASPHFPALRPLASAQKSENSLKY